LKKRRRKKELWRGRKGIGPQFPAPKTSPFFSNLGPFFLTEPIKGKRGKKKGGERERGGGKGREHLSLNHNTGE